MRREPALRNENQVALALAEIERIKALLNKITDGRRLVIDTGSGTGDTTPPVEAAQHVLYGSKHTRSLAVTAGAGLNINFEQGQAWINGTFFSIVTGSLAMTDATTNYVFVNSVGAVASNTTGFPGNSIPLATVMTAGGAITSVNDRRAYLNAGAWNSIPGILTTRGDLLTRDATQLVRLGIGAAGTLLRSNGLDPTWFPSLLVSLVGSVVEERVVGNNVTLRMLTEAAQSAGVVPGAVELLAGAGLNSQGGAISITSGAGVAGASANHAGGIIDILAGDAVGTGVGGIINLTTGKSPSGADGAVSMRLRGSGITDISPEWRVQQDQNGAGDFQTIFSVINTGMSALLGGLALGNMLDLQNEGDNAPEFGAVGGRYQDWTATAYDNATHDSRNVTYLISPRDVSLYLWNLHNHGTAEEFFRLYWSGNTAFMITNASGTGVLRDLTLNAGNGGAAGALNLFGFNVVLRARDATNGIFADLPDAAGASFFRVRDSAFAEVAEIDSDGNAEFLGYARVGSIAAPTNVTAGDLNAIRLFVGADAALLAGLSGQVAGALGISGNAALRLYDSDNSNFIAHRADAARTTDITYVWPVTDPTAGQILTSTVPAAGVATLSWSSPGAPGAHNLLSASHGDTVAAAPLRGALVVGDVTPAWARVAVGAAGSILRADGTDPAWTIDPTIAGYMRLGSTAVPSNTTAGDLTVIRALIGVNAAMPKSAFLAVNRSAAGVPTAADFTTLYLAGNMAPDAGSSGIAALAWYEASVNPTASAGGQFQGLRFSLVHNAGAFDLTGSMLGVTGALTHSVASTVATMMAMQGQIIASAGTVTLGGGFRSVLNGAGATITTMRHLDILLNSNPTAGTTHVGLNIPNLGAAAWTNAVGIDIAAQSGAGTLNFGIRNAGNMVQTGYLRIGAVTAPTNITAGDLNVLRLFVGADAALLSGLTAQIVGALGISGNNALRLYDTDNSNFIAHRADAARTTDITYVWPVTDPTAGQILQSGAPAAGVATLSWIAAGGAPTDAEYVTTAAHASLSAEKVLPFLKNYSPDKAPAAPSATDDEFDDDSIAGAWTQFGTPDTISESTYHGYLYIEDNDSADTGVWKTYQPGAAALTVVVKVSFTLAANFSYLGIALLDSGDVALATLTLQRESGILMRARTGPTGGTNVALGNIVFANDDWYLMIQRDATTNYTVRVSRDGMTWFLATTFSQAGTIDRVRVLINGQAANTNAVFDFIRMFTSQTTTIGAAP